jgi:hypothetical protein
LDRAGKPFFAQEQGDSVVGALGRAPARPASFCGKTIGPPAGILFPPMLFAHNGFSSGPQARFSVEEKGRGAGQKRGAGKCRGCLRKAGGKEGLYFESEEWEDSDFSSAGIMMPAALSRSSRRASFIFFLSLSANPSNIFQWDSMAFVLSWFRMACRKV